MNADPSTLNDDHSVEDNIQRWKSFLTKRSAIAPHDAEELESHLRDAIENLEEGGLSPSEAFLIAIQRMGSHDRLAREFALTHSERLWKHMVLSHQDPDGDGVTPQRRKVWVMLGGALIAGIVFRLTIGPDFLDGGSEFHDESHRALLPWRMAPTLLLAIAATYVGWSRQTRWWGAAIVGPALLSAWAATVFIVKGPSSPSMGIVLTAAVLVMWCALGVVYTAGQWRDRDQRLNFVRFTGEFVIYYGLMMVGVGFITALASSLFRSLDVKAESTLFNTWVVFFAGAAVVIAAWLVEAKKSVIENMAPVLARLFAPIVAVLLLAMVGTAVWTMNPIRVERDILFGYTALLLLSFALLLYSVSARTLAEKPEFYDWIYLTVVMGALGLDIYMLATMASRTAEYGASPNKMVMLALNLILAANLAWSAWLYAKFLRGRGPFADIIRWQATYLAVFATYVVLLMTVFPAWVDYAW